VTVRDLGWRQILRLQDPSADGRHCCEDKDRSRRPTPLRTYFHPSWYPRAGWRDCVDELADDDQPPVAVTSLAGIRGLVSARTSTVRLLDRYSLLQVQRSVFRPSTRGSCCQPLREDRIISNASGQGHLRTERKVTSLQSDGHRRGGKNDHRSPGRQKSSNRLYPNAPATQVRIDYNLSRDSTGSVDAPDKSSICFAHKRSDRRQ
jgi:hypothetical protein